MKVMLKDILYKVAIDAINGSTEIIVNEIHFDSRKIREKDVFVAIKGTVSDGHDFIDKAIDSGAVAIVCNIFPQKMIPKITYIKVVDTNTALAFMATNFYGEPSRKINLVGITGTNGKTTIASLLYQLFKNAGYKVGLISTVKIIVDEKEYQTSHTTPESLTINRYLDEMYKAGVSYCFMEVSSHGISQKRIEGLHFTGGVFSNLTHDHLDYHKTFAAYRDTKKSFFDHLPKTAFALTNADDINGLLMLQNTDARKKTYSLKTYSDYRAQILENQFSGLLLNIDGNEVWVKTIGKFNAYNMLAIYATAIELGLEKIEVLRLLSNLESVSGRFQYFVSETNITAIVDYAHTPDALQNVLETIEAIRTKNEQLISVVGCGGNRDKTKRPEMARIASEKSNKVIFTSDNPRDENPETILREMEAGVAIHNNKKTISITDRYQAIKTACQLAQTNDIILVAGKGHETYQEIAGIRHDFDDFKIIKEILEKLQK